MRRRRRIAPPTVARSGEPRLRRLPELLLLPRRSPLYAELARALAAADNLHLLHSNLEAVPVRPTSTRSQAGCYRLRQGDPIDIRVSRRHGRVALSFLHELGHLVDHQHGWALGPALKRAARPPSRAPSGASAYRRRYFDSAREVWARAYAQTALTRAGEGSLAALVDSDDPFVWPAAELEPVAAGVETVLAELGLLRELSLFAA